MKRNYWVLLLVFAVLLTGSPVLADGDFYVIAGGGPSGKVLKTQVFTSNTRNTTLGINVWEKLSDPQWTYTKLSATSYLVITYQDNIYATGTGWSFYQLRVNDLPSVAGEDAALLTTSFWGIYGATGVWLGLPKGDVNLSIWHKQWQCTSCMQNSSYLTTNVTVMEIEQ